jgi:hypothetical protein
MNLTQRFSAWWHQVPKPKLESRLLFMTEFPSDEGICGGCRTPQPPLKDSPAGVFLPGLAHLWMKLWMK